MNLIALNFLKDRKKIIIFSSGSLFLVAILIFIIFYFSFLASAQTPVVVPPSDVRVVPLSSCAFDVSWDAVEGENIIYNVKRGDFFSTQNLGIPREGNRFYFIDMSTNSPFGGNIDPGTSFGYQVKSINVVQGIESNWSSPAIVGTTNPLPRRENLSIPKNIEINTTTQGRIGLRWSLDINVSESYGSFQIFRQVSRNGGRTYFDPILLASVPASQISNDKYFYNDGDVDFSNSYKYFIRTKQTGGLGCNPNREEHFVVSGDSETVIIPVMPSNFSSEFVDEPRKIVLNWLDNSTAEGNETRFHIQRSTRSDFREGTIRDIYVDRDETSYDDLSIPSSGVHTYWYRIRSCIDNYCSPFTGSVFASTDIPAPINLVASVVAVDEPNVIVSVSWRWPLDAFYPNQRYQIEWGELGGTLFSSTVEHEGDPSNAQSRFFDNLEFGKNYQFRIRTRVGQDSSDWTDFIFIDTEVFPVRGWAWANVGETGGTYHGIGWIRMSWDSPDGNGNTDDSGNKYGVFFDSEGKLSGYAWAGSSQGFGWLSFNEGDIRDCPITGTCEAKIDFENEKFVGWARFISNYEGGGSWNGWVSLSNKRGELEREGGYGWRFEEEAKGEDAEKITVKVGGYAWGGDVTGWVLADFDIEVPFEWPILYDVITFTEGNDVKAAVIWENFKDYSRMKIRVKEYQEGDEEMPEEEIRRRSIEWVFEIRGGTMEDVSKRGCHGRFPANIEIPARVQERLDNLPMHCTENQTEVILKELEQGRKYHVFVRGWLVEEEKD